jgi:hypothetical protein
MNFALFKEQQHSQKQELFDLLLANKPKLDSTSSHFLNTRISPENPYERPRLTIQKSAKSVPSAAGRGKVRKVIKNKEATALFFVLPALAPLHATTVVRSDFFRASSSF